MALRSRLCVPTQGTRMNGKESPFSTLKSHLAKGGPVTTGAGEGGLGRGVQIHSETEPVTQLRSLQHLVTITMHTLTTLSGIKILKLVLTGLTFFLSIRSPPAGMLRVCLKRSKRKLSLARTRLLPPLLTVSQET